MLIKHMVMMISVQDSELVEPLSLIYKNCIDSGIFPDIWQRSHIIPTCKKSDKQIISNYHPVSLLPICSKIFEHIHDPVFLYLENNEVLTLHQSGFHPNYSCIYQLISVVHNIYADFDHNPALEVTGNFFDISKGFDKVWHEGLLYKLESLGILGKVLNLFCSFLNDRHQRVVLSGQLSDCAPILAGVSQGSILGTLLFLIYIIDLLEKLKTHLLYHLLMILVCFLQYMIQIILQKY